MSKEDEFVLPYSLLLPQASPFLHHCGRRLLQQPPLFLDQISFSLIRLVVLFLVLDLCVHTALSHSSWRVIRGCSHSHDHDHHHEAASMMKLLEELAEEEDMKLCGFGPCLHHHHESSSSLSGFDTDGFGSEDDEADDE
ncbi:Uncharacterized protein Rs2_38582 [Raphanus sativus]|nr:Uncharacterized protein Rs2_38582 [Raphanus sativus]